MESPGRRAQQGKIGGVNPFGAKLRLRANRALPPPGAIVQLRFSPPDGAPPLDLKALVWRTDRDGHAIVFVNLSSDDFLRLKRLVAAFARPPAQRAVRSPSRSRERRRKKTRAR